MSYRSYICKGISAPGIMYVGINCGPNGGHGCRKRPIRSKYIPSISGIVEYEYGGYPGIESIPIGIWGILINIHEIEIKRIRIIFLLGIVPFFRPIRLKTASYIGHRCRISISCIRSNVTRIWCRSRRWHYITAVHFVCSFWLFRLWNWNKNFAKQKIKLKNISLKQN